MAHSVDWSVPVSGLCVDSRQVRSGSVFFAIRGAQVDSHDYVGEALRKGAVAVVVDRSDIYGAHQNAVLVRSTRSALAQASARWFDHPSKLFQLVGITGTNGKTTTAYLLDSVWRSLGKISGLVGTVEYRIGETIERSELTTPDPLKLQSLFSRMVEQSVSHVAMEVSSIALDQDRHQGSDFDVVLFTNLTQDHLDYHRNWQQYYEAKRKLFHSSNACGVLNLDDPSSARLLKEGCVRAWLTFSLQSKADFSVQKMELSLSGTELVVETPKGPLEFHIPLLGRHNVSNCLGVLASCYSLGFQLDLVARALSQASCVPGRLERVSGKRCVFVDYAHTPDALLNVLKLLHEFRGRGRLICVFGCGGDRDKKKRSQMAAVASRYSDVTVVTSDNPRTENPESILDDIEKGMDQEGTEYYREVDRKKGIFKALSLAQEDDIVLVAGKGHETYQILGKEIVDFDDRLVIRDYYNTS